MYHHTLRISVFTHNRLLESEIHALEPLERFSHEVRIEDKFLPSLAASSDIVIMDSRVPMSFKSLRARAKKGARLICCMTPDEEDKLEDDDIIALDDVWLTPLRVPRIRLRMNNILYEIKRDDDAKQHMLWLNTLIDSMPDMVWFKDLDGIHHKVNNKFCEFVKKSRDMVEGADHATIWNTGDEEDEEGEDYSCRDSENAAIESGSTYQADEIVKSGGIKHLFKTYKTPLKGLNGEVLGTVGFAHDLTNMLNLDRELKFFIESMPFPLVLCRNDGKISQVNSRFLEYFKLDKGEILDKDFTEWERTTFHIHVSPVSGEHYLRFSNGKGRMRYVNMTKKSIMDIFGKKVGSFKIFRDVTAEKDLEKRIWADANTDSLTGLANRHAFSAYVRKLPKNAHISLIYIDLDEFKAVNDRWGHKAGDEALRIVAKAIRSVFSLDFPMRLGGDEFLILIQRPVNTDELIALSEKLLQRIQRKFGASDQLSRMSASIGIRAGGQMEDTMENLIRQADVAMYAAKASGKGRWYLWEPGLTVTEGE